MGKFPKNPIGSNPEQGIMASKKKKHSPSTTPNHTHSSWTKKIQDADWPVVVLTVIGGLLAGYLTLNTWLGANPLFCGEGSSCELVQNSRWGTLMGIPTSLLGMGIYLVLGHLSFHEPKRRWRLRWIISLVGLAYSLYLTAISWIVIQAFCGYCLGSLGIMATIFLLLVLRPPEGAASYARPAWVGQALVLGMLLVGGAHAHYSGVFSPTAGPEDPYLKGLAEHLGQSGAIFYGAFW